MTFAQLLAATIKRRGLRQKDLAEMVGVSESAVSLWMKDSLPSRDTFPVLLDVLCESEGQRLDFIRAYAGLEAA